MENNNLEPQEEMTVTLTMDDGSEVECVVLTIFEAGGRDYIALLPMDSADAEEGEVYLYRYSEPEGKEPVLDNIEMTRNMRSWRTHLTSCWMPRSMMSS